MSLNSLCIHGHFYQPPREDPITGEILPEAGADPFTNWNERIHAECYRPNAQLGNFEHLSFNVGPTLFPWLGQHDPETYQNVISQDRANVARYGAGNAMAQAYNHTILPLATTSDKITQVCWGIADFEFRFGRKPKGIWLPETAVDIETLVILADRGIEFTILAPWQAEAGSLDPTEPYLVELPGQRKITVFFYQRDLSSKISFDPNTTSNADRFAMNDVVRYFNPEKSRLNKPQLLLIASDGELYGHHQPFRERFLAHLLNGASARVGISPTYPALWLKQHPVRQSVRIKEFTSWSCHHGVARWNGNCDCTPLDGIWKSQLRHALDRLASALDWIYLDFAYPLIAKPRVLREKYIHVLLGEITAERLITDIAGGALTSEQTLGLKLLLEAQREKQKMFTSCGWFFDDFDRIEPRNNLAYAAQAVWLTRLATGEELGFQASADLKKVISPRTRLRGDQVFKRQLKRARDLDKTTKI